MKLVLESNFSSECSFLLTVVPLENEETVTSAMQYVSISSHSDHKGEIVIFI